MDLKDFVSETLIQIITGITEAQRSTQNSGAVINPRLVGDWREGVKHGLLLAASGKSASVVEFDVAVAVKEEAGKRGGVGVLAGPIAFGGQGQTTSENSLSSRIRYCVTVELPSP